jgi:hypothetical protein
LADGSEQLRQVWRQRSRPFLLQWLSLSVRRVLLLPSRVVSLPPRQRLLRLTKWDGSLLHRIVIGPVTGSLHRRTTMNDFPLVRTAMTKVVVRLTRPRFLGLVAAALGTSLGLGAVQDAAACRKKSARCDRSSQCCSNRCRRGFCYPREKKKKKNR